MEQQSMGRTPVDIIEHELIGGRARWVAELNEFFRDHRFRDTTFDLYARGQTRSRGFLMSRFLAWSVLPNYRVSLLVLDNHGHGPLSQESLRRMMDTALQLARERDLQWVWLIVLLHQTLPSWAVPYTERYDRKELGLGLVSTTSHEIVVSNNQVGRSIAKHLGLRSIVKRLD